MAPRFGTSGLRGRVEDLGDGIVAGYTRAFLTAMPHRGRLLIGRDLRPSSPRIAAAVVAAAREAGLAVSDCGELPTPALALAARTAGTAAVMVTGSHIPADRNGLKFYASTGEITKADERAIMAAYGGDRIADATTANRDPSALAAYARRYRDAFGPVALKGLRLGVWQHSSVARDLMVGLLADLGAEVTPLGRSDSFVPVDTEAIDAQTRARLAAWVAEHRLHAVISTDGDADRPLVADDSGRVLPGDVICTLTALALGAETLVVPVTSTTMIEATGRFSRILRTKVGSPHVIATMEAQRAAKPRIVGFEPSGGFLLGFEAEGPTGPIAPLMTRDCLLPILVPLSDCARQGKALSSLAASLPARHTAADRLTDVAPERSEALVRRLTGDAAERARIFARLGPEAEIDLTDGLRIRFVSGAVLHLRPSGNAPELRCYAEADSSQAAETLVRHTLGTLRAALA